MRLRTAIPLYIYAAITSLLTVVLYNPKLLSYAFTRGGMLLPDRIIMTASIMIAMLVVNFLFTYILVYSSRIVGRIIIASLFIINAFAEYFIIFYKVFIDDAMISNIFNTNYAEATGYFSVRLLLFILVLGVLPAIWVIWQPVNSSTRKQLYISTCTSIGIALVLILLNCRQYIWLDRYSNEFRGLSLPWSYVTNSFRYVFMYDDINRGEILLPDGEITDTTKTAVVLVIGESDRTENFQIYGYKRNNNPLLSKQKELIALRAKSCDTYTSAGVRSILEPTNDKDLHEILPNYCFRTGVDVVFRTSNGGEPTVNIKEYVTDEDLYKLYRTENKGTDEILFAGLRKRIEQSDRNKVLVIIHTNISHGPDYCSRIPKEFEIYTPIAHSIEEAENNTQPIINAYDNSIVYTDYLLNNAIDTLKTMKQWNTTLLFVSDHGESLGENGIFMHSSPKNMAPQEQLDIPFLVWTSSQTCKPKKYDKPIDQHYVFHSVLHLLGIKTKAYNPNLDIFSKQ